MSENELAVVVYTIYVVASVGFTVWVGRALFKNGQVFLERAFQEEVLATSINHLLIVGFYLLNIGFVSLYLHSGELPQDAASAFQYVATKLGVVLLVLGVLHIFNLLNIAKIYRKREKPESAQEPPQMVAALQHSGDSVILDPEQP